MYVPEGYPIPVTLGCGNNWSNLRPFSAFYSRSGHGSRRWVKSTLNNIFQILLEGWDYKCIIPPVYSEPNLRPPTRLDVPGRSPGGVVKTVHKHFSNPEFIKNHTQIPFIMSLMHIILCWHDLSRLFPGAAFLSGTVWLDAKTTDIQKEKTTLLHSCRVRV